MRGIKLFCQCSGKWADEILEEGGGVGVGVADGWGEDGSDDDGIGDGSIVWGGKMTLVLFDVGGWLPGIIDGRHYNGGQNP